MAKDRGQIFPDEWRARRLAARVSFDTWDTFMRALEPGPEMDYNVLAGIYGHDVASSGYPKIDKVSTDWGKALTFAVSEMDYFCLTKHSNDQGFYISATCDVEHEGYCGRATEQAIPLAVARAILDLYTPSEEELAEDLC